MNRTTAVLASCFIAVTLVACDDSGLDEQAEVKETQSATRNTVKDSQQRSTLDVSNPLSLVKMIELSGPEADGFHNCFWVGPVSSESYNIAYPDEGAVYWGTNFQLPKNASHLEISGNYPDARYMSYNASERARRQYAVSWRSGNA